MKNKQFIFLGGMHRSGTSLLHEIIRGHEQISGFSDTGVDEDEGQHLQSVYEPAISFGGPGKFAFDKRSYMNEVHPLATSENAQKIYEEWSPHYDLSCPYLIEKSPPNLIRTRFFQKLYPNSKFIIIFRHPLAISYATEKWSKTSISSLLDHTLKAYEAFFKDMRSLNSVYILRYEEFVKEPQKVIENVFNYLSLDPVEITHSIRSNINDKYFVMWEEDRKKIINRILPNRLVNKFEERVNNCGYSITDYNNLVSVDWLGAHHAA